MSGSTSPGATARATVRALIVDPSLFTAPYDAALNGGLVAAGVSPTWVTRPTRHGDRQEIPTPYVDALFYRRVDRLHTLPRRIRAAVKGVAHLWGLVRLVHRVMRQRPEIVHFQWLVVPPLDLLAMRAIRHFAGLVVTVHDTVPFNGDRAPRLQTKALAAALRACDALVVHTHEARQRLIASGVPADAIAVIPHGPLALPVPVPPPTPTSATTRRTFTLFGELKPYKGIDILLQAVARLPAEVRDRARFVIAGRPRMDLAPIEQQMDSMGLRDIVELRPWRASETEMAGLFGATDCFLFPYRRIDASGVYYLTKALRRWVIATRVGVFAEELAGATRGTLVAPESPEELAQAIADVIVRDPKPAPYSPDRDWTAIGEATLALYRSSMRRRGAGRRGAGAVEGMPPLTAAMEK